nr:hypothetical protein [uncultured Olsenella sp.]
MRWTTGEIRYLEEHAADGAASVARALGRSRTAVERQASRYGLTLRRHWLCPRCGRKVYSPLSARTGWCQACTREQRIAELADEVGDLEREVMREEEAKRERQRLYSRKSRAKKRLESMSSK